MKSITEKGMAMNQKIFSKLVKSDHQDSIRLLVMIRKSNIMKKMIDSAKSYED